MERAAIQEMLVRILEENTGEKLEAFDDSLNLRTQLGLDSIDLVSMLIEVQQQLGVNITVNDVERITQVGELIDLIQARQGARKAA